MKKFFYILISFLFISCATTKTFETNDYSYEENNNTISTIQTSEYIEAIYEPNTSLILFDVFGMLFVTIGLTCRETGRVIVYTTANASLGYVYGMLEDGNFMEGLWLPDIEQTKKELNDLNDKFNSSDYIKYKKYTKHWAKTTLNIKRLTEEFDLETNSFKAVSMTQFTLVYIDSIYDTVERVSKKASLVGETVGSYTSKIVAFPPYSLGWAIGSMAKE